jgi:microcystin-dependent protein
MANYEATKYDFDGANLTGIEGTATGTILPWSAASLPSGFLECAGADVSRTTYSALFAVIGTTYGAGDGSTTFGLPDLADNVPVGKSGTKALASTGGANTASINWKRIGGSTANATLSTAQLASHYSFRCFYTMEPATTNIHRWPRVLTGLTLWNSNKYR